jgi:hypothetical protein
MITTIVTCSSSYFVPAYATTIRISTSGIAAAAARDTIRTATDEAAPTKYAPHTKARKAVVSLGCLNPCLVCTSVVELVFFEFGELGSPLSTRRETRLERVPVTIVVTMPILLTCFAHPYWIPIEKAAKKTRTIFNEK